MARAVMRLFPGVQLAFGPTIENGFYYDIDSPTPIKEEDFPRIEEEMRKIVAEAEPFERFERPTAEARGLCQDLKQTLKVEHIDDDLKQYPMLSFYRQGEFIDAVGDITGPFRLWRIKDGEVVTVGEMTEADVAKIRPPK